MARMLWPCLTRIGSPDRADRRVVDPDDLGEQSADGALVPGLRIHGEYRPRADEGTLARIERAREDAARHLAKDRDLVAGPDGRQALATAIFARADVMGFQRLEYELTTDAIELGLDAALPPVMELESQIGEFGRGERI